MLYIEGLLYCHVRYNTTGMTHIKIEILSNDLFTIYANEKNTYRAYCDDRYHFASFQILRDKRQIKCLMWLLIFLTSILSSNTSVIVP